MLTSRRFLVIARNRPTLKIRNVLRRSEEEVERKELVNWLRNSIAEQRRIDASYALVDAPMAKEIDGADPQTSKTEIDIRLVLPPEPMSSQSRTKGKTVRKYRHVTKTVYYDKAHDFALSVKSSLPVLGVDLPTDLLSRISHETGWVNSGDEWRSAVLSSLPTSERHYAEQVRDAVKAHQKHPGGNLWLFSVRDARGYLLQLTR